MTKAHYGFSSTFPNGTRDSDRARARRKKDYENPNNRDDSAEDTAPADTAETVEEPAETTPSKQPWKWVAALC